MAYVHFSNNRLSGTISTQLQECTNLISVRLERNDFEGSLPEDLSALTELQVLDVHGNPRLSGSMPSSVCALKDTSTLGEVTADCLPSSNSDTDGIVCSCCTTCCEPGTDICEEQ